MKNMTRSLTLTLGLILMLAGTVWAGKYDLKTVTPEIQQALDRRQDRYDTLQQLKAHQSVGEDNLGHVANLSGLPEVQLVVDAENYDRELIYQAIVAQNELGEAAIQTVRSVFAQVQRNKAQPGEKIQMPNGEWMVK